MNICYENSFPPHLDFTFKFMVLFIHPWGGVSRVSGTTGLHGEPFIHEVSNAHSVRTGSRPRNPNRRPGGDCPGQYGPPHRGTTVLGRQDQRLPCRDPTLQEMVRITPAEYLFDLCR